MSAAHAIVVQKLSLVYATRDKAPLPVLEEINLTVAPSEFVCVVGPSGCGKTTLMNIIAGFLAPSSGEVLVGGKPVHGPTPDGIVVHQENSVFPWLDVASNVAFGLQQRPLAEQRATVARTLEMVGLSGFERSYPHELSGGMRQRVEIARVLAANPATIYMDEPFGALDFITRLKLRGDLVRIWQQEKKTILFVTHDIEEAVQLADRVVVLSARPGRVQEIVPIDLPRPRDLDSPGYLAARDRILQALGLSTHVG